MPESNPELNKVISYIGAHWPSSLAPELQVKPSDYPALVQRVITEITEGKTTSRNIVRIAGISGSGKTTQLLPATEAYFKSKSLSPVLIAARVFVPYHPHYQEILTRYGASKIRQLTDDFSTIMLFLTITSLIQSGYDIILDVSLLSPEMEQILQKMLDGAKYKQLLQIIAVSASIASRHLNARDWRHNKSTEEEFLRATSLALDYYADNYPELRIIIWNTYDEAPVYDGPVRDGLEIFSKYSKELEVPAHDEQTLKEAKIKYLSNL